MLIIAEILIGLFVYRQYKILGVLVLLTAFSWYPISSDQLSQISFLFTGASISSIFIIGLGIATLGMHFLMPNKVISLFVPFIVLTISTIGWLLTLPQAPYSQTYNSFRTLVYLMCVFIVCVKFIKTPKQAELICWLTLLSFTLSTLIIYVGYYIYPLPFFFIPQDQVDALLTQAGRLQGAYQFPGAVAFSTWAPRLSGILASILLFPIVITINKGYRIGLRIVALIIVLFLGVALLRTGGRGGWLALLAGFLVIWIVGVRYKAFGGISSITQIALPVIALFAYAIYYLQSDNIFIQRINSMSAIANDPSFTARVAFWQRNLEIWQAHPSGIGFISLQLRYGFFEHNAFLILLNGIGPFGLLSYLFFGGWVAFRCLKTIRNYQGVGQFIGLAALGSLVAVFLGGFVENIPFLTDSFWFIWGSAVALSYRIPVGMVSNITKIPYLHTDPITQNE